MTKHLLTDRDKERIFDILEETNVDISLFSWEERKIGLRRFTTLLCQPRRYYFVFSKKGDRVSPRTFFPCWKESRTDKDPAEKEVLVTQLHKWIDSIDRVRKRQKQLIVPVEKGASTRRSFARISETLKTRPDIENT